jgi:hypothetical protein
MLKPSRGNVIFYGEASFTGKRLVHDLTLVHLHVIVRVVDCTCVSARYCECSCTQSNYYSKVLERVLEVVLGVWTRFSTLDFQFKITIRLQGSLGTYWREVCVADVCDGHFFAVEIQLRVCHVASWGV